MNIPIRLMFFLLMFFTLSHFHTPQANALVLDEENRQEITLRDGTVVQLLREYGQNQMKTGKKSNNFYYLPTNLRLSLGKDGRPDFMFLHYTEEDPNGGEKAQGARLHLLVEWGLSPEQKRELSHKLSQKGYHLKGAVPVRPKREGDSVEIITTINTIDDKSKASLIWGRTPPILEGDRMAIAGRMNAEEAQIFHQGLLPDAPLADMSLKLSFEYDTLYPAMRGYIKVHWDKLYEHYQNTSYSKVKKKYGERQKIIVPPSGNELAISPDWPSTVVEKQPELPLIENIEHETKSLVENRIVEIKIQTLVVDNEKVNGIEEMFLSQFMKYITQPVSEDFITNTEKPPADTGNEDQTISSTGNEAQADSSKEPNEKISSWDLGLAKGTYIVRAEMLERRSHQGTEIIDFPDYRMTVPHPYSLGFNLKENRNQLKSGIKKIFLGDPFYKYHNATFCLDLQSFREFEKAFNMASVHVRKLRKGQAQSDFQFAITPQTIKQDPSKSCKSVEFSQAGELIPSGGIQYKTQWSLANGMRFPQTPQWQEISDKTGNVTLYPPVMPKKIRLQAIHEELLSSKINRVIAHIRFHQFGKLKEDEMRLSVYKPKDTIEKTIFIDRDESEIEYQLVFYHNTKGKIEQPEEKIDLILTGDSYVIDALVPQELYVPPDYTNISLPPSESHPTEPDLTEEGNQKSDDYEIIFNK